MVLGGCAPPAPKELVAVTDGERESTESWAELPRDPAAAFNHGTVSAGSDAAFG